LVIPDPKTLKTCGKNLRAHLPPPEFAGSAGKNYSMAIVNDFLVTETVTSTRSAYG
jgi:hypothetical protein